MKTKKETLNYPSYYTIIPAEVRYCKELRPAEKLLYGEITALSNKLGYCYAKNTYLGELYGVEPTTVSEWISNLEKNDLISITGASGKNRRISLTNILRKKVKVIEEPKEKPEGQPSEKEPTNNTSINNHISKDISAEADLPTFDSKQYFTNVAKGKKKQQRIIAFFGLKKKKYEGMKSAKECNAFLYNPRLCSVAKRMEDFPDDNINKAFYVAENMIIRGERVDWSLELVERQLLK